jgi:hypothetical protein
LEKENAMNVRFRSIRVVAAALAFVAFLPTVALVFEDKRAFDEFTGGNFEFAAGVSAVAITAGASASAGTGGGASAGASGGKNDAATVGGYKKGMAIFTVAKGGLMYEASIGGQKFKYTPKKK